MFRTLAAIALLASLTACASTGGRHSEDAVVQFLERAEMCEHFAGEEPYDGERRAEINKNLNDLRCSTLVRDGEALRVSRRDRPDDLRRIDEALAGF